MAGQALMTEHDPEVDLIALARRIVDDARSEQPEWLEPGGLLAQLADAVDAYDRAAATTNGGRISMDTRTLEIMELDEMQRRIDADPAEADHLVEVTGTPAALAELRDTVAARMREITEEPEPEPSEPEPDDDDGNGDEPDHDADG